MKSSRAVKPSRVRGGAELEEVNAERRIWREEKEEDDVRRQQTNGKSCQLAASLRLDNTRSGEPLWLAAESFFFFGFCLGTAQFKAHWTPHHALVIITPSIFSQTLKSSGWHSVTELTLPPYMWRDDAFCTSDFGVRPLTTAVASLAGATLGSDDVVFLREKD